MSKTFNSCQKHAPCQKNVKKNMVRVKLRVNKYLKRVKNINKYQKVSINVQNAHGARIPCQKISKLIRKRISSTIY